MDVDENLRQNYIQFDPAPRKGNEVEKKRVPDYFLWFLSIYHYFVRSILFIALKNYHIIRKAYDKLRLVINWKVAFR